MATVRKVVAAKTTAEATNELNDTRKQKLHSSHRETMNHHEPQGIDEREAEIEERKKKENEDKVVTE